MVTRTRQELVAQLRASLRSLNGGTVRLTMKALHQLLGLICEFYLRMKSLCAFCRKPNRLPEGAGHADGRGSARAGRPLPPTGCPGQSGAGGQIVAPIGDQIAWTTGAVPTAG